MSGALTLASDCSHRAGRVSTASSLSPSLLTWLSQQAGFPGRRLPAGAELLLCLAAAAELDAEAAVPGGGAFGLPRQDGAMASAQRAHALRRSRVHFKCDNSAKV